MSGRLEEHALNSEEWLPADVWTWEVKRDIVIREGQNNKNDKVSDQ